MAFPGKDLPPDVRKKAWAYATNKHTQDLVTSGFDPLTLYVVMGEYENAIDSIRVAQNILGFDLDIKK